MQDNVTQAALADEMLQCDMWRGGILVPVDLATRIRNRLASTAQPEVRALVEALAMSTAELMRATDALPAETNKQRRLIAALKRTCDCNRQALAAYHEAQP